MANSVPVSNVDRRTFLNGRWPGRAKEQAHKRFEVASLLVQARP